MEATRYWITHLGKAGKFFVYFSDTGSDVVGGLLMSHVGLLICGRRGPFKGLLENITIFSRSKRSTGLFLVGKESGELEQYTEGIWIKEKS